MKQGDRAWVRGLTTEPDSRAGKSLMKRELRCSVSFQKNPEADGNSPALWLSEQQAVLCQYSAA